MGKSIPVVYLDDVTLFAKWKTDMIDILASKQVDHCVNTNFVKMGVNLHNNLSNHPPLITDEYPNLLFQIEEEDVGPGRRFPGTESENRFARSLINEHIHERLRPLIGGNNIYAYLVLKRLSKHIGANTSETLTGIISNYQSFKMDNSEKIDTYLDRFTTLVTKIETIVESKDGPPDIIEEMAFLIKSKKMKQILVNGLPCKPFASVRLSLLDNMDLITMEKIKEEIKRHACSFRFTKNIDNLKQIKTNSALSASPTIFNQNKKRSNKRKVLFNNTERNKIARNDSSEKQSCIICKRDNHSTKECRHVICNNCFRKGHTYLNCTLLKANMASKKEKFIEAKQPDEDELDFNSSDQDF